MGSIQACSRTEKRAPKRSCPGQPRCVNDHRGRIRAWSRRRPPRRGHPHRMRRWQWRRPEPAPHEPGPRRPRHPQFLGAAVVLWSAHRCSTHLVVLALGVIPRTPPGELPFRWHARHGNRARNRAGGREREPEAATNVSAAWEAATTTEGPIQPGCRQGLYCPAWFSRRLPVLTCYPATCHKPPASTDLQAQILTDDPRLDLGATAESQQNP
jgi:hypothetical protein